MGANGVAEAGRGVKWFLKPVGMLLYANLKNKIVKANGSASRCAESDGLHCIPISVSKTCLLGLKSVLCIVLKSPFLDSCGSLNAAYMAEHDAACVCVSARIAGKIEQFC